MVVLLFIVLMLLMLGAAVCFILSFRQLTMVRKEKRNQGIPEGRIVYSDLNAPAEPLFSHKSRLVGKPDYIVRQKERLLPVEVKSGGQSHPQHSHVLQLAAYCQILEDVSGEFIAVGILVYNTVPYTISFDPQLRFELNLVMTQMRDFLYHGALERNHQEPGRCAHCSLRWYCDDQVS
ncbi:MAG TPA: Dna2/Cas4 domain-containing protein [Candidatus Thermoplasmatota archaeon]|nr:Dna2/Cas4 domain-containing protein [Candidatus Thermoplasmatota archaeon]